MKPRHPLIAFSLAGILWAMSLPAPGAVIHGETVTAAEAAAFPPVCKLIIIEQPEANISAYNQRRFAALFDRPEYRMAKNAPFLHHWCRGMMSRHRYFNTSSELKRRGYKASFHDEMNWVIRHMGSGWPYGPLIHAENGEMYLLEKKYAEAVNEAFNAIRLNPAFPRGHGLLVSVYNAMGQKDKALEAATEGLRHNPASNTLKRMYDNLGGAKPYPEPVAKPSKPLPEAEPSPPLPPLSSGEFKAADEEEAVTHPLRSPDDAQAPPPNSAVPGTAPGQKRYCRFCP